MTMNCTNIVKPLYYMPDIQIAAQSSVYIAWFTKQN